MTDWVEIVAHGDITNPLYGYWNNDTGCIRNRMDHHDDTLSDRKTVCHDLKTFDQ